MSDSAVILEARDLEKTYDMGDRGLKVLRGVSIEVRRGEVLAIQGPSGAGKSTLLHLLGLLDEPDHGRVLFRGEDVLARPPAERARYRNRRIGFVFQFYHLFPDLTALENVCLPRMVEKAWGAYAADRAEIEARARHLLEIVGLKERMAHRPSELSGGERQRVAIARALMNEPEVLLCDEPTGNLDQKTAGEILDLLWRLNKEQGQTFVIVTHDEGLARRADRVVRMVDGAISDGGPARPRGFAETKFRLREKRRAGGWSFPPVLAAALALLFPGFGALVWMWVLHGRFQRATRRGHSAAFAVLGHLIPLAGNLWPLFIHVRPLRDANRILHANGEPRLRFWAAPLALWPVAFYMQVVGAFGMRMFDGAGLARTAREHPVAVALFATGSVLLAAAAAWIQSLHNRFYDRMRSE